MILLLCHGVLRNAVGGKLHLDSALVEHQMANVLEDEINSLLLSKGAREKEQGLLNAALHRVPRNAGVQEQTGIIQEKKTGYT